MMFVILVLFYSLIPHQCNAIYNASIVVMHGFSECMSKGGTYKAVTQLQQVLVSQSLTNVYQIIQVGLSDNCTEDEDWSTYKSMFFQLDKLCSYMSQDKIMQKLQNSTRIILVGGSQGAGLIKGYLWSNCSNPFRSKIDKLITFGGINDGIWGIPKAFCDELPANDTVKDICKKELDFANTLGTPAALDEVMYTILIPFFSPASYWNSPLFLTDPLRLNTFLAIINNENPNIQSNPVNYMSGLTKGFTMVAFGDDTVIVPPISAYFGYWYLSVLCLLGPLSYVPYYQTNVYNNDTDNTCCINNKSIDRIGLKELDDKGLIQLFTIPNEDHGDIPPGYFQNNLAIIIN